MKKPRFRKEDWLELGLAALSKDGPEAIKLEAICKAAGLTRGSFYYHFEDHETFVTGLATHWFKTQTEQVAATMDAYEATKDQIEALTEAAMHIDYRLELAMRELARRIPAVQQIVQQADQTRLAAVTDLYQARYGISHNEAAELAFLEYAAFSGLILISPDMDIDAQRALAARYDHIIETFLSTRSTS